MTVYASEQKQATNTRSSPKNEHQWSMRQHLRTGQRHSTSCLVLKISNAGGDSSRRNAQKWRERGFPARTRAQIGSNNSLARKFLLHQLYSQLVCVDTYFRRRYQGSKSRQQQHASSSKTSSCKRLPLPPSPTRLVQNKGPHKH